MDLMVRIKIFELLTPKIMPKWAIPKRAKVMAI